MYDCTACREEKEYTNYVIVVTHARVPHGIYWLSSDLGPRAAGLKGKGTTEPIYPMCARVSCVTTDLLHSLCIPFRVHITPFIGQLVSTTCGGCGMHQTHEKRSLPTKMMFNNTGSHEYT